MKIGNFDFNVKQVSDEEKELRKQERKQRRHSRIKYRLIGIGICLIVVFIIAAIGGGESKSKTDKVGLRTDSGYQDAIKNGVDKSEPREIATHNKNFLMTVEKGTVLDSSYTFKEVFNDYFESPKWRAFHDTESNQDVAEFTGKCLYNNKKANIIIQITVDQNNHIAIPYMSVNDVGINSTEIDTFLNDSLNEYIQNNVHG